MKRSRQFEKKRPVATSGSRFSGFVNWLTGPVEALPLRIFEIWFAVTFPARLTRNFPIAEWLTAEGYHVTPAQWRGLGYPEAFPLLSLWGAWLFIALTFLAVAGLAFDLRRRKLWLGILFASAVYAQGVDYLAATSANKQFIAVFFILLTGPGLRRCEETGRWLASAATLRAIQGTILVLYFSAGWAKAFNGDWLKFNDVLFTQVQGSHRTEFAAWALRTWPLWFWTLNQHLALVFELGAPLLLGVRKLRPIGFALGIGMHLVIALTMFQLIYFSTQMWAYYALFVSAAQWRALARRPGRWQAEGRAAFREAARRFWEGWMGSGWRPGLPAWATQARGRGPALYLVAMLLLWLIPFFHAGWKKLSWPVFPKWWSFQHSAAGLFTQRTPVWWDHHLEARAAAPEMEDGGSEMVETGKGNEGIEEDSGGGEHVHPRLSQEKSASPAGGTDDSALGRAGEGTRAPGPHAERESYVELPERSFFTMGAFGYRTRLDRILNESHRGRVREEVRERLARHVFDKERELHEIGQNADGVERRPAEPTLPQVQELRLVRSLWRVGTPDMAQPAGAWDPPPVTELPDGQRLVLGAWQREEDGTVLALKVEPDRKVRSAGSPGLAGSGASAVRDARAPGVKVANERIRAALALQARLRSQRQQSGQASGGRISPLESAIPHSGNAVGGKQPNAGRETQPILQENGAAVPAVPAPDGRAARPSAPSSVVRPPGSMRPLPRPPLPIRGAAGAPLPEKQGEGK